MENEKNSIKDLANIKEEYIHNDEGIKKIKVFDPKQKINRAFKGVWIPKEIWIDDNLSWIEKLFFVEIDSLDNDKGCFASNNYFANFFNLTSGRCSQIINSLIDKKYISVIYEKYGKQITKRVLKILNRGIKYSKGGYIENDEDNNILINNTINILSKDNKGVVTPNTISNKIKQSSNNLNFKDSSKITKICMKKFYQKVKLKSPKVKEDLFFNPKEVYKCENLIKYIIKGFPNNNFSSLKNWTIDNKKFNPELFQEYLTKGLKEKFMESFLNCIDVYKSEFQPDNKKNLPNRLSDFLYNKQAKFIKSYFYLYLFDKPKPINSLLNDLNPEITKKYLNLLDEQMTVQKHNKLILFVKEMIEFHKKQLSFSIKSNILDKEFSRKQLEGGAFSGYFGNSVETFFNAHINFLQLKFPKGVDSYKINLKSFMLDDFVKWYKEYHGINIISDMGTMKQLLKTHIENLKATGKLKIEEKEKSLEEQLIEIEDLISKCTSQDTIDIFESEREDILRRMRKNE